MEADYGVAIPTWYQGYASEIGGRNFIDVLRTSAQSTAALLRELTEEKWNFSYTPGKWNIKELILHLTDAERIFSYRALCFSRNDKTNLPGFEENEYAPESHASNRSALSIIEEYISVRNATLSLFENLDQEQIKRIGTANEKQFSVLLIGVIIAGHEIHHIRVLKERYL